MLNRDIKSREFSDGSAVTPGGRTTGRCDDPAVFIADALAAAIGLPLVDQDD